MILNILNNKSSWKLLALISYGSGAGYTRKEIKKLLRWNNLSLDRAIKKLQFYKIIRKEGRIIKLDFSNERTGQIMELLESEKKRLNYPNLELFLILHEFIRLSESKRISEVYLFGSHAKKTAKENSDIDLAIFSKEKVNAIEAKDSILQEYGKEIQPHYFRLEEKSRLIEEVKKHGIRII
jgi:predicted nucleotidyltransferase